LITAHAIVSSKIAITIQRITRSQSSVKIFKNFAFEAGNYKITSKNKSLVSVSMIRDLLAVSYTMPLQAEVDMEQILQYPLTLV